MNASELEIDPEVVQRLVLARLFVPLKKRDSRKALLEMIAKSISPPLSKSRADAVAARTLEELQRKGYVSSDEIPQLTASGEQTAQRMLGFKQTSKVTWKRGQQIAILGLSADVTKMLDADGITARVLANHHELPGSPKTAAAAVDRLAWKRIGRDTDARFTPLAVQRYLLRDIVPFETRVKGKVWRRLLAMRALNAAGHDANQLTRALLCNPPRATARTESQPSNNNRGDSIAPDQPSLADFARAVRDAARGPGVTRFHDDRAFIGSVWEHMRGRSPVGDMSLDDFKHKLITAHRQELLQITRADLVGAMDPNEVERSEARYQNATFHFVALDAGGVR